ncbi:septum formation family protein [Arthrobacter sp. R-11]|uniref:septum formation family protein n=1 Tax=Arthrobacter sp. R-11 TaxID=3404053 RepID=UPI003CE6DD2B
MLSLSRRAGGVAALLVAVSLALAGCSLIRSGDARRDESGRPTESSKADVLKLRVGDCISGKTEGVVGDVTVIPCGQEHELEAFAATKMRDATYPGADAVSEEADDFCFGEFTAFIGKSYEESTLEYRYFQPTALSWRSGDREILCLVGKPEGAQSKGTLRGSRK